MKNIINILIFYSVIFSTYAQKHNSQSPSSFVVGNWLLEKVAKNAVIKNINRPVEFKEDGKIYMMNTPIGTWEYHPDQHSLFLNTGNIKGEHQIVENGPLKLTVKLGETITYFTKIDPEKILKENQKSHLEGIWKLNHKIEDYLTLYIRFELPDHFLLLEKTDQSSGTTKAIWTVNTQHKTLKLMGRLEHFSGTNSLEKVSDSLLVIKNNGRLYTFKKVIKPVDIEHLTFSSNDFYDDNGNYKYEEDNHKLPWQDRHQVFTSLRNIKQLSYQYSELIKEINCFETQTLKATLITDAKEEQIIIDNIFKGFDRNTLPEDAVMPVVKYNEYSSSLFPLKDHVFRVLKHENIRVPAGNFACTVVEVLIDEDIRQKIWFINHHPGIIAKLIEEKDGNFGYYHQFELKRLTLKN